MAHRFTLHTALTLLAVAGGCSSYMASADQPPPLETSPTASSSADKPPPPTPTAAKPEGATGDLTLDEQKAMEVALRRGGDKAAKCADVVPGGPRGEGEVTVTFDGTIGKITEIVVGAPFAGTEIEGCISRAFINEYGVRFVGKLEVPYTIKLAPRAGDAPKPKPGAKPPAPKKK